MKEYHEILGVPHDASLEEIKDRFRYLAQAYHPDKFKSHAHKRQAEADFKEISEAYQALTCIRKAESDRQQALQAAHAILPSLEDLGGTGLSLHDDFGFVSNEEAARMSHPDDPQASFNTLLDRGKIGTVTLSYAWLPYCVVGFFLSLYRTADGAATAFRDYFELDPRFQGTNFELAPDLGDERMGRQLYGDKERRRYMVVVRRRQLITLSIMVHMVVGLDQSVTNLRSFARLMDVRAARFLGVDCPPIEKPEWIWSDALQMERWTVDMDLDSG